jgi:hypothetical protein
MPAVKKPAMLHKMERHTLSELISVLLLKGRVVAHDKIYRHGSIAATPSLFLPASTLLTKGVHQSI